MKKRKTMSRFLDDLEGTLAQVPIGQFSFDERDTREAAYAMHIKHVLRQTRQMLRGLSEGDAKDACHALDSLQKSVTSMTEEFCTVAHDEHGQLCQTADSPCCAGGVCSP